MIFHINLKIVKTFLSVFLFFHSLIYCTSMTFVLQLHFVKMKLNLKQEKKMQKKLFCVLIIYCTLFFLLPLIGLHFHLN